MAKNAITQGQKKMKNKKVYSGTSSLARIQEQDPFDDSLYDDSDKENAIESDEELIQPVNRKLVETNKTKRRLRNLKKSNTASSSSNKNNNNSITPLTTPT